MFQCLRWFSGCKIIVLLQDMSLGCILWWSCGLWFPANELMIDNGTFHMSPRYAGLDRFGHQFVVFDQSRVWYENGGLRRDFCQLLRKRALDLADLIRQPGPAAESGGKNRLLVGITVQNQMFLGITFFLLFLVFFKVYSQFCSFVLFILLGLGPHKNCEAAAIRSHWRWCRGASWRSAPACLTPGVGIRRGGGQ